MSNKKYYIVVTPFFPSPDSWRGAYVLDQVKAIMRNSDYEVVVIRADRTESEYKVDGVKVYTYRTWEMPSNILNGIFNGRNARSFVRRVLALGIDPQQVALVHCHVSMSAACGLALKRLNPNIKVLLQHHDLDPVNLRSGVKLRNNRFNIRYRAKKAIALYDEVDLHICISEACRECLTLFPNPRVNEAFDDCLRSLKLCEGLPAIKVKDSYVLYNGVDKSLFEAGLNGLSGSKGDGFRIGCIGNFQELKDHITLIKAFERFVTTTTTRTTTATRTTTKLSLLGTGETRAMCEEYIREHGLEEYVEWPSEVTHDKLPEYYRSLDLFVLPSYFEGFGCVYTEAAACGVPFMGCVNQGYSEYIPDEEKDKWLIQPHDYEQLARLIERYYKERNEQRLCHSYDINELVKDYLKYIEKI